MRKAFTLIELLVVIAVIGVLAAVLVALLNPKEQLDKAKDAGKISRCREVIDAAERYFYSCGEDPESCEALEDDEELKAGACEGVALSIEEPEEGCYVCTFEPYSRTYFLKCGEDGECLIPDDLLEGGEESGPPPVD